MPKNLFLASFFEKNLTAAQKIWPKQGILSALEELKNHFDQIKKGTLPQKIYRARHWSQSMILKTQINRNQKLSQNPDLFKHVIL